MCTQENLHKEEWGGGYDTKGTLVCSGETHVIIRDIEDKDSVIIINFFV